MMANMNSYVTRAVVLVLWNLLLNPVGVLSLFNGSFRTDFCPEVTGCSCFNDKDAVDENSLLINCKRYVPQLLTKLPSAKITTFQFYDVGIKEEETENLLSILKNLRNHTKELKRLKITGSNIDRFDLEWLPDKIESLAISYTGLKKFTYQNCLEESDRLYMLEYVFLYGIRHEINLTCVPHSVEKLFLASLQSYNDIKWPTSLRYLKISRGSQGYFPPNFFKNMTQQLHIFWISQFPFANGVLPVLPDCEKVFYIAIQHCNISIIKNNTFYGFKNLTTLNLAGNRIKTFENPLSKAVNNLLLYENLIENISDGQWGDLEFTLLDLHRNKITSVPQGLPSTLVKLYLQHNLIETCSSNTFLHLKRLKTLDLSHNRLTTMPTGLQPGLIRYNIAYNELSHVPGPAAYSFCSGCNTFRFGENKWYCNANFFGMLVWIAYKASGDMMINFNRDWQLYSFGKCMGLSKEAFTVEYLRQAGKYKDYISKPPFSNCSYDAQSLLNCTDTNLAIYPKAPPNGLKKILIVGNRDLRETPDYIFSQQTNLKWLSLQSNSLRRIPYGLPSSLKFLILSDNNITELTGRDVEAFQNLTNLKELLLHKNHLKTLYPTQFTALKSLRWFGLERNDLVCDCSLQSFVHWYENLIPRQTFPNILARYAACRHPKELEGRDVRSLMFIYKYQLQCVPVLCYWDEMTMAPLLNCSLSAQKELEVGHFLPVPDLADRRLPRIPQNAFWETLTLDGLQLEDSDIALNHLSRLKHVDLSNNLLTQWPIRGLPSSLEDINLSNNTISRLPSRLKVQQYLPNLKSVDLRNNKITTLNSQEIGTIFGIGTFFMAGNPLACNCSLSALVTWVKANGSNSHQSETWGDLGELQCHSPPDLQYRKFVDISIEEFCKSSFVLDIKIWIAAVIFIIMLASALGLCLQVSRRRRYEAQIISGFQKLVQEQATFAVAKSETTENERCFLHEAFVATDENNQDGEFLDRLIQELEETRHQRLCVSSRDFAPGTDVADNIVDSIRASKRVILIFSKSFVTSPWCHYEVQVALTELQQRQKKLLIPIMLEDLTKNDNLCRSLKTFMSLMPTMTAPGKKSSKKEWEKFWDSLEELITN